MLSKVITISQQKGGTGKTTLAVHLALAFIKYHNLKVAIIDTDPQGSLGKWFMIRTEKKISNDNLTFKTASLWGAQYESKILKQDHDIIIIDTDPQGSLGKWFMIRTEKKLSNDNLTFKTASLGGAQYESKALNHNIDNKFSTK